MVYDHADIFEGPEHLLHVFCRDAAGRWVLDEESLRRADEAGCGLKGQRGDRCTLILTPEEGRFSQMMLPLSRSLGDFYLQTCGVTREPEVVVHDLASYLGDAPLGVMCVATDGIWDHWTFEEAMKEIKPRSGPAGLEPPTRSTVESFFEVTRYKVRVPPRDPHRPRTVSAGPADGGQRTKSNTAQCG